MSGTRGKNWSTVRAYNRHQRGKGLVRVKTYRRDNRGRAKKVTTWRRPKQNQSRAADIIGWLRSL